MPTLNMSALTLVSRSSSARLFMMAKRLATESTALYKTIVPRSNTDLDRFERAASVPILGRAIELALAAPLFSSQIKTSLFAVTITSPVNTVRLPRYEYETSAGRLRKLHGGVLLNLAAHAHALSESVAVSKETINRLASQWLANRRTIDPRTGQSPFEESLKKAKYVASNGRGLKTSQNQVNVEIDSLLQAPADWRRSDPPSQTRACPQRRAQNNQDVRLIEEGPFQQDSRLLAAAHTSCVLGHG